MQSALECRPKLHIAIIMDGNGRWATARGLARTAGHRAGVETVRRVCEAAPDLGVTTLTLFAFSADNWRRPPAEVGALMGLLRLYLRNEVAKLIDNGTRLSIIGWRDRLPGDLAEDLADAEAATAAGDALHLRIALDYSSRDAILQAASVVDGNGGLTREAFGRLLSGRDASGDVDLLIRTGGEKRLSDFLLWECAYAELYFTDRMWPDFDGEDLAGAMMDFRGRERRFGAVGVVETHAGQIPSAA
jgi:undecaprenyl diphosphate synthase